MWYPGQCQGTSPIIALAPIPPKRGPAQQRPPQQPPPPPLPRVTTYNTAYDAITLIHVPRAVFTVALALGYHHFGDFYTPEGILRSANDLRARVPQSCIVDTIRTWLRQHDALLRSPGGGPGLVWLLTDGQHQIPFHDRHDVLHGHGDLYLPAALVHHPCLGGFGLPPADDRRGGGWPYRVQRPRLGGLLPLGRISPVTPDPTDCWSHGLSSGPRRWPCSGTPPSALPTPLSRPPLHSPAYARDPIVGAMFGYYVQVCLCIPVSLGWGLLSALCAAHEPPTANSGCPARCGATPLWDSLCPWPVATGRWLPCARRADVRVSLFACVEHCSLAHAISFTGGCVTSCPQHACFCLSMI